MLEELVANAGVVGIIVIPVLLFIILYCRDVIKLKMTLLLKKKKGAKFVVRILNDKNIVIEALIPKDNKFKLDGGKHEVGIEPNRLHFSRQFGVQAAIIPEGASTIFDPFLDKKLDPVDGELIDLALKKAQIIGSLNEGWLDTKEQKLMMAVIVICLITAALTFATQSQLGAFVEFAKPALSGLKEAVTAIPRPL